MRKIAQVNIGDKFGGYTGTTSDLLKLFIRGSLTLAGVIVLFLVLLGGFKVIQGAGNNNPQQSAQGKQAFTYAILGLVVIVMAYAIIVLIEAITGSRFVTRPFSPSGGPSIPM